MCCDEEDQGIVIMTWMRKTLVEVVYPLFDYLLLVGIWSDFVANHAGHTSHYSIDYSRQILFQMKSHVSRLSSTIANPAVDTYLQTSTSHAWHCALSHPHLLARLYGRDDRDYHCSRLGAYWH